MPGHGKLTTPVQIDSDLARPITVNVNLLCFLGADPPQGDVPPVYWGSDWHALSQNWK